MARKRKQIGKAPAADTCPSCGRKTTPTEVFCPDCGQPLSAEALKTKTSKKLTKEQKKALKALRKDEQRRQQNEGRSLAARISAQKKSSDKKRKTQRDARRQAKSVQDAIGFVEIYDDGIAKVEEGLFSQTIQVPDINFRAARPEEQDRVWNLFCNFYNSFPSDVTIQLTLLNRVTDASARFDEIKLPYTSRTKEDMLVDEYNDMLAKQVAKVGRKEITRTRFFTFSVPAADHETAIVSLATVMNGVLDQFDQMGAHAHVLNGSEYLALVGHLLRPDDKVEYDIKQNVAAGVHTKDVVSPTFLNFTPDGTLGKNDMWSAGASLKDPDSVGGGSTMWYQALQFRDPFPATMDPSTLGAITSLPFSMCVTIQVHPIEQAEAIELIRKKLSFMKSQEAHEGRAAARDGLDPVASRSINLTHSLEQGDDTLDALMMRNERMFTTSIMITLWDRDREELSRHAFQVATEASKRVFILSVPQFQNRDAMNTMLPFGNDYLAWHRNLLTTELATFVPFVTQEISERGGIFYGNNTLSGNMIVLNRKRLTSPMGWIMGQPGYGKSFAAKQEIFATAIAHSDDNILIIDPKGEYTWITHELGGTVIDLAAGSNSHINLFDLNASYSPDGTDPVIFKSEFITSTLAALLGERAITPRAKSIIDRTVAECFRICKRRGKGEMPTLTMFWQLLKDTDDGTARDLADDLEIYVKGSLRTFAYPTNVDLSARIIDVNMKRLTGELALFGQLVTLDCFWNRVTKNNDAAVRTWLYIDEAQNFFKSEAALNYFTKCWAEGRSYGLIPTGITQNIDRVIGHSEAKHMFSNSGFVELLSQSPNDLSVVRDIYNLSESQAHQILNAKPGHGLIIAGPAVIPFANEFPKDTELYELFDTDPNSAEDKRKALEQAGLS